MRLENIQLKGFGFFSIQVLHAELNVCPSDTVQSFAVKCILRTKTTANTFRAHIKSAVISAEYITSCNVAHVASNRLLLRHSSSPQKIKE